MTFQPGSTVIHAKHGLGKVLRIEETLINGQRTACYIVQIRDLTVWVPIIDDREAGSLRTPTPESEFEKLFKILRSPCEPLPEDRRERKTHLLHRLSDGDVTSTCRLVRDLSGYSRNKRLSDDDKSILERAQNLLLAEWVFSLAVSMPQAQKQMSDLLQGI